MTEAYEPCKSDCGGYICAYHGLSPEVQELVASLRARIEELEKRLEAAEMALRQGRKALTMPWLNSMEESQVALELFDAALAERV